MKTFNSFQEIFDVAPQQVQQKLLDNKDLRENPAHHPEENAFEHIKIVTNRLISTNDPSLILAGLFHDICKKESAVQKLDSQWFLCKDHEKKGVAFALRFANFIHSMGADLGKVLWIVDNHMRIKNIDSMKGFKKAEIENNIWYDDLVLFSLADDMNIEWSYEYIK